MPTSVYSSAISSSRASSELEKEKYNILDSLDEVQFASQKAAYAREKWGKTESLIADTLELVSTASGMMEDKQVFEEEYLPGAQETIAQESYEGELPWEKFKGKQDMYSAYLSEFDPQKVDKPWWDVLGETEYKFGEKGGTFSKGIIAAAGKRRKGMADAEALLGKGAAALYSDDDIGDEQNLIDEVSQNAVQSTQDTALEQLDEDAKKLEAAKVAAKEKKEKADVLANKAEGDENLDTVFNDPVDWHAENTDQQLNVKTDKPDKMAEMMKKYKEQDLNPSVTGGAEVDWFDPARAEEFGWVDGRWI